MIESPPAAPQTGALEALMTVGEVAETLRLCEKAVYSLSKRGRLPSVKMNARRLYRREDVRRFIAESVTNEAEMAAT